MKRLLITAAALALTVGMASAQDVSSGGPGEPGVEPSPTEPSGPPSGYYVDNPIDFDGPSEPIGEPGYSGGDSGEEDDPAFAVETLGTGAEDSNPAGIDDITTGSISPSADCLPGQQEDGPKEGVKQIGPDC
jgi:hypothetical protein